MSKGKNRGGNRHIRKPQLAQMVIDYFTRHTGEVVDVRNLFRTLGLNTHPGKLMCMDVLDDLVEQDFLIEREPLRYERTGLPTERERRQKEAEERRKLLMEKTYVGRINVRKDFAFLLTENREVGDLFIPKNQLKGAQTGDKVTARIVDWPEGSKNPVGKVVEVLGRSGENEVEMHAILAEFGLPYTYPKNVEEAANQISDKITPADIAEREDFRDVLTFTIDPRDAKDFDDALSFREIGKGKSSNSKLYEIGVHIADVSHYVTEGSIIDKEAIRRGTSVYLVDRTVPMLPERLCNYICSLRPDEDKLCYSVIFEMNEKAEVKRWHLAHTIIRSDRRFAYEEVQALFEARGEASPEDYQTADSRPTPNPSRKGGESSGLNEGNSAQPLPSLTGGVGGGSSLEVALITLNRLAKLLRERRFQKGAVDFERPEVRFDIDEKGKPLGTYIKVAKDANKLIEEFMLLANRTVAESIGRVPKGKKAKVLPYRIHEQPDQDKLANLSQFVTKFGHKLKYTGTPAEISKNLNKLLHDVHGTKEQNLVEMVALRAMMKARYSIVNVGHYGLAFDYYTHFTSPIRRYPDLMVHRLLSRYAEGGRSANPEKYEALCDLSSENEQTAALAERASIKYKQVEFMADKIGKVFEGTISGVTEFGLYVELNDNHCEGMIPLRDMDDDYYEFDERNYQLWGKRHHRRFTLGDPIQVRVAKANLDKKQLDFALVTEK
jgi:ribonuclease R